MTSKPNPWLKSVKPDSQVKLRLFCFPYAGGGSQIFQSWGSKFPPYVEVLPVNLPGRGARLKEAPFTRASALVEAVADAILPYLNRPFAFFGHSMGAIISFELARFLRQEQDLEPVHLFVSGRPAPQIPDPDPPTYGLPDEEFIEELRRLKGTPKEVLAHPELMQLMLPLLRGDFELCQTYHYEPETDVPLKCPIKAFGGLQDEEVPRENIVGWQERTSGPFSLHMLPGDHFFLHTSEAALIQALSREAHLAASLAARRIEPGTKASVTC